MAGMRELKELVKELTVEVETPENKAEGKDKFSRMTMEAYLGSIGKSWVDLDEALVRANLGATWVAREGTSELPVPFADLVL